MQNDKLKELKKEYAKKKKQLIKEELINKFVESKTNIKPSIIHTSELYGCVGSVKFFDEYNGVGATLKDTVALIKAFKPSDRYIVKSACMSISHAVVTAKERKKETVIQINPYIICTEGLMENEVFIKWFSYFEGVGIIEIEINLSRELFNSILKVDYDKIDFRGGYRIANTRITLLNKFMGWEHIRWATGSDQYPNKFTIYHRNLNLNILHYIGVV